MPVSLVNIHHEGAGAPTNDARGAPWGYSCWIGLQTYKILRAPQDSWATLNFNHRSFDICLSGNRHPYTILQRINNVLHSRDVAAYEVSDGDLWLIAAACKDARDRGWLTDRPTVVPHRFSPGSRTACPGNNTMRRWNEIVAVCQNIAHVPPASPDPASVWKVQPVYEPPIAFRDWTLFVHPKLGTSWAGVKADGAVYCEPQNAYLGGPNTETFFAGAAKIRKWRKGDYLVKGRAGSYTVESVDGSLYCF